MSLELLEKALSTSGLTDRGVVVELLETGEILVDVPGDPPRRTLCDFLQTTDGPALSLEPGHVVLVLLPRTLKEHGCVLGRVGRYRRPDQESNDAVIEAKKSLTLKCGQSSIEMRRDGRLLVKGVDVVTRAKRTNKIKGGSVHIN